MLDINFSNVLNVIESIKGYLIAMACCTDYYGCDCCGNLCVL